MSQEKPEWDLGELDNCPLVRVKNYGSVNSNSNSDSDYNDQIGTVDWYYDVIGYYRVALEFLPHGLLCTKDELVPVNLSGADALESLPVSLEGVVYED